jgi:hypothetical protein
MEAINRRDAALARLYPDGDSPVAGRKKSGTPEDVLQQAEFNALVIDHLVRQQAEIDALKAALKSGKGATNR